MIQDVPFYNQVIEAIAEALDGCRNRALDDPRQRHRWYERWVGYKFVELEVASEPAGEIANLLAALGIRFVSRTDEGVSLISIRGDQLVKLGLFFQVYLERRHPGFTDECRGCRPAPTGDSVRDLWANLFQAVPCDYDNYYKPRRKDDG